MVWLHMCHQNTKVQVKNERWSKISPKAWSWIFLNCESGKRHLLLVFHLHLCTIFFMTIFILNHTNFFYGISLRTNITKKGWISPIGSLNCRSHPMNIYIICSDEAYFYLAFPVNNQNNCQWSKSQLCIETKTPLHDQKIFVWCEISANRIFVPYYVEDTVNQHNYLEVHRFFFWPKVLSTSEYEKYYFQQDGARLNIVRTVQTYFLIILNCTKKIQSG